MKDVCPFCDNEIIEYSKDHVFPQFLGGRTTINCCKTCNNLYGTKFEGFVANEIKAIQGMIMSWGLRFHKAIPVWKNAFQRDGLTYNMNSDKNGKLTPELSKPQFEKDNNGSLKTAIFQTEKEATKFKENLLKSGNYKRIEIEKQEPVEIVEGDLGASLVIGNQLKRTALKMCIDLIVKFNEYNYKNLKIAKFYLYKEYLDLAVETVIPSYINYSTLDSLRPGLSHLIYVERNRFRTYGIVQFFGVVQVYCTLGEGGDIKDETAFIGILDPFNAIESFQTTSLLNIKAPSEIINPNEHFIGINGWLNKYRLEAIKCDAEYPPDLRIEDIDFK